LGFIVSQVRSELDHNGQPNDIDSITAVSALVFFAIGWLTMLYEPDVSTKTQPEETQLSIVSTAGSETFKRTSNPLKDLYELPCYLVLQHFGDILPPCPWLQTSKRRSTPRYAPRTDIFQEYLVVNYLNFQTLSKVATIKLEFVSSLSLHLEFDEETKILKLFQFPSWCYLVICGDIIGSQKTPRVTSYLSR
jgi:hypothetical protein